jgi:gliding motility-associated-like protein
VHLIGECTPLMLSPTFYTYAWTPSADVNPNDQLEVVFSGKTTTNLTLTATTPKGCVGSDNVIVQVVPADFLVVSSDKAICPRDTVKFTSSGAITYHWSPGTFLNDSLIKNVTSWPTATTNYTLIGIDINGCMDTVYRTVTVMPNAVVNLGDDQTLYPGQTAQLYAQGNCSVFSWAPITGLDYNNIQGPVAQPPVSTQYVVAASTEFGCKTTDTITVNITGATAMAIANAFTPGNGNSPNNMFKIDKLGIATLNKFQIFDRWGVMVFETTDINKGWNGMYNDKPQPLAVYVYHIDALTKEGTKFVKTGNVTLIR